jgi:hypothetical protein
VNPVDVSDCSYHQIPPSHLIFFSLSMLLLAFDFHLSIFCRRPENENPGTQWKQEPAVGDGEHNPQERTVVAEACVDDTSATVIYCWKHVCAV